MQQKVLHERNIPTRLPFWTTVTLGLLLDRAHAPAWLWGAATMLVLIVWGVAVYAMLHEQKVELWKDEK